MNFLQGERGGSYCWHFPTHCSSEILETLLHDTSVRPFTFTPVWGGPEPSSRFGSVVLLNVLACRLTYWGQAETNAEV